MALIASNGGDGISLREAILAANADVMVDFSVTGTIPLGHAGEIAINSNLTIKWPRRERAHYGVRSRCQRETTADGAADLRYQ